MSNRTWTGTVSGDWGVTSNWLEAAVPITGDSVYFYNNAVSVTAGLNQSSVSISNLISDSSYTGSWGTGVGSFLQVGASNVVLGAVGASGVQGAGSNRLNLDLGTVTATVTVLSSAFAAADTGEPPVRLKGSALTVNALSGYVGVGTEAGDTVTVAAIRTQQGQINSAPIIYAGQGTKVTEFDIAAGTVTDNSNQGSTKVILSGGTYNKLGTGATTTLTINAGNCVYNGTGTITQANVYGGSLDFSNDTRSKTVTNCTTEGGTINANNGNPNSISFTNGILLQGIRLRDVNIDVGYNRTVSIS